MISYAKITYKTYWLLHWDAAVLVAVYSQPDMPGKKTAATQSQNTSHKTDWISHLPKASVVFFAK